MRETRCGFIVPDSECIARAGSALRGGSGPSKKGAPGINPNAPAGGGGPGYFKNASCVGGPSAASSPTCTLVPAARYQVAQAGPTPASAQPQPKPPPKTNPVKETVKAEKTNLKEVAVYVEVLSDGTSQSVGSKSAHTQFNFGGVSWASPGYSFQSQGGKNVITQFNGKFVFKGTVTVQTLYGSSAKATDVSLYGRGTTQADKKNGHVTLGFHEHCHQQDYLKYLKDNPLPDLNPVVGMAVDDYKKGLKEFEALYKQYSKQMEAHSKNQTDEVGYTLSQCKKDGKCT